MQSKQRQEIIRLDIIANYGITLLNLPLFKPLMFDENLVSIYAQFILSCVKYSIVQYLWNSNSAYKRYSIMPVGHIWKCKCSSIFNKWRSKLWSGLIVKNGVSPITAAPVGHRARGNFADEIYEVSNAYLLDLDTYSLLSIYQWRDWLVGVSIIDYSLISDVHERNLNGQRAPVITR